MPYKGDWEGLRDEGRMAKRYRDGLSSKEEPLPKNVTLLEGDFDFAVGDE
jgi:hypothetical protein